MTDYSWVALKCNKCGEHMALPKQTYYKLTKDGVEKICCPLCENYFQIYGANCGTMQANMGLKDIKVLSK